MIGRIKGWLALAGGFVMAVLAAWVTGRREGGQKADRKNAQSYIETRKRIDETNLGDDPDVLRDFLRNRDPNKR